MISNRSWIWLKLRTLSLGHLVQNPPLMWVEYTNRIIYINNMGVIFTAYLQRIPTLDERHSAEFEEVIISNDSLLTRNININDTVFQLYLSGTIRGRGKSQRNPLGGVSRSDPPPPPPHRRLISHVLPVVGAEVLPATTAHRPARLRLHQARTS